MELEDKLVKRKSVLAMMKSWRGTAPQSAQRNHPFSATGHSPNDSSDEHGVLSVYSESTKNPGVVYIEPLLSSKTNDVKKRNVDVLVTSVPESRSESTIQVIPGNGKRDRRIGSVRKIWNTLTGRTMRI
jgi:hypothetical protein